MSSDFVMIGEAAEILGLSRTSLQKLVDGGHLAAVKTAGGHRRISRDSLEALATKMGLTALRQQKSAPAAAEAPAAPTPIAEVVAAREGKGFIVLVAEDDEVVLAMVQGVITRNFPEITLLVARDGLDAVLQLERTRPHLVITDLNMAPFDGFQLIRLIRSKPEYQGIALLVMSALSPDEVVAHGGLPADVLLYRKPVHSERLLGFLDAHVQALRQQQTRSA
jgi:excisionase family DNA binding protein